MSDKQGDTGLSHTFVNESLIFVAGIVPLPPCTLSLRAAFISNTLPHCADIPTDAGYVPSPTYGVAMSSTGEPGLMARLAV